MLGLAGLWNFFDGLLALANSKVYGVHHTYVFSDLRTWGWIVLFLGDHPDDRGLAIFTGSQVARWFGITAAGVNAIGQLAFVPVYPFLALMLFPVDVLVVSGLAVGGTGADRRLNAERRGIQWRSVIRSGLHDRAHREPDSTFGQAKPDEAPVERQSEPAERPAARA